MDKNFSVEQMKKAFLDTDAITEQQLQMLKGHYTHRVCSFEAIATFAGCRSVRTARLQYGWMCRRIAWQLGFRTHHRKIQAIASEVPERDAGGNPQWRMDDVVAEALEQIGWVKRSRKNHHTKEEGLQCSDPKLCRRNIQNSPDSV